MSMPDAIRVVHLEAQENWIEVGSRDFLVARDAGGRCHTVANKCPHRGGPLHLGAVDATGTFIVCPWHHSRTRIGHLAARGLPTVRSGGRVTVVIGADLEGTPHAIRRLVLLDCERARWAEGREP
jgi:nitrite reductase/ring-hydroxylating ferredoxin subunit